MTPRCLFALLGVVVLSLLMMSASALSRSDVPRSVDYVWVDDSGPQGDGPDDYGGPEGGQTGDDDNWDKPVVDGHRTTEVSQSICGRGEATGSGQSEEEVWWTDASIRIQLRLLLRTWALVFIAR
jgi:hypothetical protein